MREWLRPRVGALVAAGALLSANAGAQTAVTIFNVVSDVNQTTLFVTGMNFCATPTVTLGGQPLQVLGSAPTIVTTNLPSVLPGTYYFVLSCGTLAGKTAYFNVAIGAVGPKGSPGDPGARGSDGAPGPTGPTGPTGATTLPDLGPTIYQVPSANSCADQPGSLTTSANCQLTNLCSQNLNQGYPPSPCVGGENSVRTYANFFQSCAYQVHDTCYNTCFNTCYQTCFDTCYDTCHDTCGNFFEGFYDCNFRSCNPHSCNPHNCNPFNCNPYQCSPYDCNFQCGQYNYTYEACYSCSLQYTALGKLVKQP